MARCRVPGFCALSTESEGQDSWGPATTMSQLSQIQPFHTSKMPPQPAEKWVPSPLPPETSFPQLTAEPLCPASPRSPGMPTSPYTREGTEGVSGLHVHMSRGQGLQILTGTPGSPEGPASPSSPGLPCRGGVNPECLPVGGGGSPLPPGPRLWLCLPLPLSPGESNHVPVLLSHPWTLLVRGDPVGQRSAHKVRGRTP